MLITKTGYLLGALLIVCLPFTTLAKEVFPDGTTIPEWFYNNKPTDIKSLGKHYSLTDYEVSNDSTLVQTKKIQAVIDAACNNGGGVIVVPQGTF